MKYQKRPVVIEAFRFMLDDEASFGTDLYGFSLVEVIGGENDATD